MRTYSYIGLWSNRRALQQFTKEDGRRSSRATSYFTFSVIPDGPRPKRVPDSLPSSWRITIVTPLELRMDKETLSAPDCKSGLRRGSWHINGFSTMLDGQMVSKIWLHPILSASGLCRRLIVRIDADAGRVCDLKRENRPCAAGIKLVSGWALLSTHPLVICARNPAG